MKTITIGLSKFRATCLKLMDEVKARRFIVVITKRGKPIAKMTPLETGDSYTADESIKKVNPDNVHPETDFGGYPKKPNKRTGRARQWKQR